MAACNNPGFLRVSIRLLLFLHSESKHYSDHLLCSSLLKCFIPSKLASMHKPVFIKLSRLTRFFEFGFGLDGQ